MTKRSPLIRPSALLVVGCLTIALGLPVAAQSDRLAMLAGLTKGEWTIKFRDGTPSRKICLKSGAELIQLQHSQANCEQIVLEDGAAEVRVHYTCRGNGYGDTVIRRETGTLVQVNSNGYANGLAFQVTAEARRSGSC
ncbi:MAG: hypothetical protein AAGK02_08950 [Pseudomonadota bacterium]